MSIKLRSGNGNQLLPEGTYDAALSKVEESSNAKGPFLKWHFEVSQSGEARMITGVTPMNLDLGSRTIIWVESLLGRPLRDGEEIDLERLIGRSCRLVLYVATLDDGRKFNRIEKVLRRGGLTLSTKKGPDDPIPSEEMSDGESAF